MEHHCDGRDGGDGVGCWLRVMDPRWPWSWQQQHGVLAEVDGGDSGASFLSPLLLAGSIPDRHLAIV